MKTEFSFFFFGIGGLENSNFALSSHYSRRDNSVAEADYGRRSKFVIAQLTAGEWRLAICKNMSSTEVISRS